MSHIPGYSYGSSALATSPVTLADFEQMKASALLGAEDLKYLRMSEDVVKDQVEAILDVWYGFIGSQPQLLASFTTKTDGSPSAHYLGAVRKRFAQWLLDTARAEYDQKWLDYQHEIGLRHFRTKKNVTDAVPSTDIVPFRNLFGLIFPVTFTLRPFLAKKGHSAEEVDKMHSAWLKSCLLQVTLWSHPYLRDGAF
jgi:hypothetical protein